MPFHRKKGNRLTLHLLTITLIVCAVGMAWAQSTVYVKRGEVSIRSGVSASSPEVTRVRQGDPLTVIAREGARYRIRTSSGAQGYIPAINVTDIAPNRGPQPLVLSDNTRIPERSSAGSIRGLNTTGELQQAPEPFPQTAQSDLQKMEQNAQRITATDIQKFRAEGGIVAP